MYKDNPNQVKLVLYKEYYKKNKFLKSNTLNITRGGY